MPFFFLLISSFKPGQEMIRNGLQFKFDFENYSLVNYDMLLSGAVMSVLPIMIIFAMNQKAFIAGLTVGSVKG
ncbi:MAG: hypothetical protein IJB09_08475 [Oscillospiraceae bacterium]|nr:hypothetical protein [Oscillospiraceae bacterium]